MITCFLFFLNCEFNKYPSCSVIKRKSVSFMEKLELITDIRDIIIIFFGIFSFETFPEDETLKVSNERLLFTIFFSFSPLSSCFVRPLLLLYCLRKSKMKNHTLPAGIVTLRLKLNFDIRDSCSLLQQPLLVSSRNAPPHIPPQNHSDKQSIIIYT